MFIPDQAPDGFFNEKTHGIITKPDFVFYPYYDTYLSKYKPCSFDEFIAIVKSGNVVALKETDVCKEYLSFLSNGRTPLGIACFFKHPGMFQYLLENGADPLHKDIQGWTVLDLVVMSGQIELLKKIKLTAVSANASSNNGQSPLHVAALSGNKVIAEYLIEHGASMLHHDDEGHTPLHSAVYAGYPEVVKLFVHKGANLQWENDDSIPLMTAIEMRQNECAKILYKADPSQNIKGNTALHMAAAANNVEFMEFLLSDDTILDRKNDEGLCPIHVAVDANAFNAIAMLVSKGCLKHRTEEGYTPLHFATTPEMAQFLIQNGADPEDNYNEHLRSPGVNAFKNNHWDVVKFFEENYPQKTEVKSTNDIEGLMNKLLKHNEEFKQSMEIRLDRLQAKVDQLEKKISASAPNEKKQAKQSNEQSLSSSYLFGSRRN